MGSLWKPCKWAKAVVRVETGRPVWALATHARYLAVVGVEMLTSK